MSENIIPTQEELYRQFIEESERLSQEAKKRAWVHERSCNPGIRIIPSDGVPSGYRRMVGTDIFVSPANYELLRPMTATGMLVALGCLREEKVSDESEETKGNHPLSTGNHGA